MTNYDDSLTNGENDPEISIRYRELANETAPKALDRIVLRTARKALRNSPSGWSAAWYRPAGFVATLGLSLALFLQFNHSPVFTPTTDPRGQTNSPAEASVFQDAADEAAISVRESSAIADESLQLSNAGTNYSPAITDSEVLTNGTARLQHCNDEQIALPDQWWQCIQELRKSGRRDDADVELAYLHEIFPDYMPDE
jgi:hypothetical protein